MHANSHACLVFRHPPGVPVLIRRRNHKLGARPSRSAEVGNRTAEDLSEKQSWASRPPTLLSVLRPTYDCLERPASTYVADVVSPGKPAPAGRRRLSAVNTCDVLGNYIDNARLDYVVGDLTTSASSIVTTQPINTRYGFGGGFFGDYTDIAAGSDDAFHALWTDSNNVQNVTWFYGFEFVPNGN